jgi:hypothetical protein
MVAADTAPVLSSEEIDSLLDLSRLADTAGVAPGGSGWVETYDLNRAAAEGWRWKAGKAAASYDFSADGATFNRSQILAHCEKMAAQYQRRTVTTLEVTSPLAATAEDEDDA